MRTVMVRYKVRPECAAENQRLIEQVLAHVAQARPAGLDYRVFKLDDGVSFVHIAAVESVDPHPLTSLEGFRQFTAAIRDRCEEPPVTVTLHPLGAPSAG
jgi:hypothetical protein